MGQKVNPHGFRVGVIDDWDAKWYANKKNFSDLLIEDNEIRKHVKNKFYTAGVSKTVIERTANRVKINIYTAKPGIVIGKGGQGVDELKKELVALTKRDIIINIIEVKNPEANAQLVAENIASQLEKRISFRKAMKQSMGRAMRFNYVKGVKTMVAGRLGGAEIARCESYHNGTIPLQTLRADIEYGFAEAHTTYGKIGVKVWVYKGEILGKKKDVELNNQNARENKKAVVNK